MKVLLVLLAVLALASAGPCPGNKPPVNCFMDPCKLARCPAYPNATCHSNYCGGCFADFYDNGVKVDCRGSTAPAPSSTAPSWPTRCPPSMPPVNCFRNPCQGARCSVPGAVCQPDYCGGCFTKWFVGNKMINCTRDEEEAIREVENKVVELRTDRCPPGVSRVYCFVDPCAVARCEAHPEATCVSDYCGGCNAHFMVDGVEINCA